MDGSKPAICGHLKTGHFRRPETGVEIYFTASSVGNVFAGALTVTPEAPGQLDSLQYRQIQLADLFEQRRGRGPGQRFRPRVPPLAVLFLQRQKRLHGVVPLLWPRPPVRWPTVPDPRVAGLAPLPVTCLPLRVRQRHTTMLHRYVTARGGSGRPSDRGASVATDPPQGCLVWSDLPGGFRAGSRSWSCRTGVPSRDATAGLGRTVWSTTTSGKGRCVERPLECRGRLVWRTRRRWGRSVSVVAPDEPGGGAFARAGHVRMGVDARPRANPPRRCATPGQLAEGCRRLRTPAERRLPESGRRKRAHGVRTAARCESAGCATDSLRLRTSCRLYRGGPHPGAPASRPALEHVCVMQEPVEQRGDRGGVAEELAPLVDRASPPDCAARRSAAVR